MRLLVLWIFSAFAASAETLEMLILEVDQRLVEPTLAKALGKDRGELDDTIGKLRKLAGKGVVEHAAISLEVIRAKSDAISKDLKASPPTADESHRMTVGHQLRWYDLDKRRELTLKIFESPTVVPEYKFFLLHNPDGRWSLSTALATQKGALLIFEKVAGREDRSTPAEWALAAISEAKPASPAVPSAPAQWFTNPPSPYVALLRQPPDRPEAGRGWVLINPRQYNAGLKGFFDSSARFMALRGYQARAGLIGVEVAMNVIVDSRTAGLTTEKGDQFIFLNPLDQPISATEPFEASVQDLRRHGDSVTSTAVPSKHPTRYLQTLLFRQP